jgi:hypothetical protein
VSERDRQDAATLRSAAAVLRRRSVTPAPFLCRVACRVLERIAEGIEEREGAS